MIYGSGSSIVFEERGDVHSQEFLNNFHDARITRLAISGEENGGKILVSGQAGSSLDKDNCSRVGIWDIESRPPKLIAKYERTMKGKITALDVSSDGRFVTFCAEDNILYIYDIQTRDCILSRRMEMECSALKFGPVLRLQSDANPNIPMSSSTANPIYNKYPSYMLAACIGKEVYFMNIEYDLSQVSYTVANTDRVAFPLIVNLQRRHHCAVFAYPLLILGTNSGELAVINVPHKTFRGSISLCANGIHSLVRIKPSQSQSAIAGADGLELYAGGGDGVLQRVRLAGGQEAWDAVLQGLAGHPYRPGNHLLRIANSVAGLEAAWERIGAPFKMLGTIKSLSLLPDNSALVAGSSAGRIYYVLQDQAHSGGESPSWIVRSFSHAGSVNDVSCPSSSVGLFATCAQTGEACVWSLEDYSIKCYTEFNSPATSVFLAVSTLIVGYADGSLRGFALDQEGRAVQNVEHNPHGASLRNRLKQSSSEPATVQQQYQLGLVAPGNSTYLGLGGSLTAASAGAKHATLSMPVSSNATWCIPNAHRGAVTAITVSGTFIVTGGHDETCRIWAAASRSFVAEYAGTHKKAIAALHTDVKDPYTIHVVSNERIVSKFDVRTGVKIAQFISPRNALLAGVTQRRDHEFETVYSTSEGAIGFWDSDYQKCVDEIRDLCGDSDPRGDSGIKLYGCKTSPCGKFIAAGAHDHTLYIFDVLNMKTVFKGEVHTGPVVQVAWTGDGKQIVSVCQDGTIGVWNFFSTGS